MHGNLFRCLMFCAAVSSFCQFTRADIVIDWNRIAADVLAADLVEQHPGQASRTMAMTNLAIYDAFQLSASGGTPFYDYSGEIAPVVGDVSRDAAAAQAAYTVLSSNYPALEPMLAVDLADSLGSIPDSPEKTAGTQLGASIGSSIVARRADDGYDADVQFVPTGEVGRWEPDLLNPGQEAWGPVWGEVRPFSIQSGDQFTAPPIPDLTSPEYAAAFNEVKDKGALHNTTRTDEQTEIGVFWAYDRFGLGTPMRLFNQVLQTVAEQQDNTPDENAELFARATVAMIDAGIVSWTSKYDYDFWRPISAIRRADEDGNPLTEIDPDWVPLGSPGDDPNSSSDDFTPPFPTYVSGHATFGGALFSTLADFYGTDDVAFTLTSEELPGVERSYTSFSQAMEENGRSRVYLGVHFFFDDLEGQVLGSDVAEYIASRPFVARIPEPASVTLSALASLFGLMAFRSRGSA